MRAKHSPKVGVPGGFDDPDSDSAGPIDQPGVSHQAATWHGATRAARVVTSRAVGVMLAVVVAGSSLAFVPPSDHPGEPAPAAPIRPVNDADVSSSTTPLIFDNFNRTVSNGWGGSWFTNVTG